MKRGRNSIQKGKRKMMTRKRRMMRQKTRQAEGSKENTKMTKMIQTNDISNFTILLDWLWIGMQPTKYQVVLGHFCLLLNTWCPS